MRQKLPDGWRYNKSVAVDSRDEAFVYMSGDDITFEEDEDFPAEHRPAPVALAVIRNAGKDPVYDEVKRVLSERNESGFGDLDGLQKLIESLEEP